MRGRLVNGQCRCVDTDVGYTGSAGKHLHVSIHWTGGIIHFAENMTPIMTAVTIAI